MVGYVDHGKTTLLDKIRGTAVAAREPGQITQWVGSSLIPAYVLKEICSPLLEKFKFQIIVPGLLFIDTPGHETFSNLRKRGGSAADIAILVIDIIKGVEPQTIESLNILKSRKTPFLVVANKIDLISGWKPSSKGLFTESFSEQSPDVKRKLDELLYSIMGSLSELGFNSERFDRVKDFKTTVAIVPASAKTGEGIPELLAVLIGLTQAYMKEELLVTSGPGKGTVLEVKEEVGLGTTMNAIIYDGIVKVNDTIVIGGKEGPIVTKIRAILLPKPLDEIRDPRDKFLSVNEAIAASGVKIVAPNLENALAGSSLYVAMNEEEVEKLSKSIVEEVESLKIKTDKTGIILKTDTLGSLEALTNYFSSINVPIRLADVGDVSKREVIEAEVVKQKERLYGVVLAFNVKVLPDAEEEALHAGIPIFKSNIIYHLIEEYTRWLEKEKLEALKLELNNLIKPGKIKVMPGYVFRRSKPAIVGVEVLSGAIKPKYQLINEKGKEIGEILGIQDKGKNISEALANSKVAISIDKAIVGRHINEGETLYVAVPESHVKILLTKFKENLSIDELQTLDELIKIMRKIYPLWGF
ncbi:MAG: translation initiation factor IF-2 [Candidatus Bathyarchaeia archaeon]